MFGFRELYPEQFSFLPPLKEGSRRMAELLFGNDGIVREDVSRQEILEQYAGDSREFARRQEPYRLYE